MSTKELLEKNPNECGYLLWWLGRFPNRRDGKGLNRYDQNGRIGSKASLLRAFVWERTKDLYRRLMEMSDIDDIQHIVLGEQYDLAVRKAVDEWIEKNGTAGWAYKMPDYWRQYEDYKAQLYIERTVANVS